MGVKGLWDILSGMCERKPLTYLTGKKVAIDLSGWVVQAIQCQGLNKARNPHLRNLFFRVSRLLELGVFPIFVTEGKPPALKEAAIKSRNADRYGENSCSNVTRSYFDRTLKECEDLLCTLGVPCVKSSGEAEAFCALLCLRGVVSGVVTEDNDAFLYGADIVYKDFSIEPNDSHVNVYCLKSKKNKYNLDQKKLVALALLLGCDYSKGVPGIGKETAIKLLEELDCDDILQRFKDWRNLSESVLFPGLESQPLKKGGHCNRCGHLGSSSKHKKEGCSLCDSEITCYLPDANKPCKCPWHKNDELLNKWKTELKIYKSAKKCTEFPNTKVIDEYLNFNDTIPTDEVLNWTCPKLVEFQDTIYNMLGWTIQHSFEKILPIITSWQQYKLQTNYCDKSDFFCEPVEILKERSVRGDSYFEVKWKLINENSDLDIPAEKLVTSEYGDRFAVSYKDLVDNFFQELKAQKQSKKDAKKAKVAASCRKVKSPEKYLDNQNSQELPHKKVLSCNYQISSQDALVVPKSIQMEISPNKQLPDNDSFNGLLDVPLFERIKFLPKALLQNYETTSSKIPDNRDDLIDILFNNSLNDSSFSFLSHLEKQGDEIDVNFKIKEKLSLSAKTDNANQIINMFLNNSLKDSGGLSSCAKFSNVLDTNNLSEIENMDISVDKSIPKQEVQNVDNVNAGNVKNVIYLNFSDSDDSFLNILNRRQKYQDNVYSPNYINVEEDIKINSCSTSPNVNFSKHGTFGLDAQKFSTPLVEKSNLSPSFLYSLKHSMSRTRKNVSPRYLLSEIFNNSSPDIETKYFSGNSYVNSPNSSKMHTQVLYSPLTFDSSIDEL